MKENIISETDAEGSHSLQLIANADKFNQWMYQSFSKHLQGEILEIGKGIGNISKYVMAEKHHLTLSGYYPGYKGWLSKSVLQIDLLNQIAAPIWPFKRKTSSGFVKNIF